MRPQLLLACGVCSLLGSAELVVRDLRVAVGTRPADFDFDLTTSIARRSGSDAFDGGATVEGGLRWSLARPGDSLGLVVGADLAADAQSYGDGDGLATLWAKATIGLGWAATDRLTLLGEGLAGYGRSRLRLPATAAAEAFDAAGPAVAYEARLTGLWQVTRGFNAGLTAGWLVASHELDGDDSRLTLDQSGWYAALVFSWRLSDVPPRLE